MADYKPSQAWPMRWDGENDPRVMQQPVSVDQTIDRNNWDPKSTQTAELAAGQIVQRNIGQIEHFIQSQRLVYGTGLIPVYNNIRQMDGMTVQYINQFGREQVFYNVSPISQPNPGGGYAVLVSSSKGIIPKLFDPDSGTVIWSGGPPDLIGLSTDNGQICVDTEGYVVVAGTTRPSTQTSIDVQKISKDGNSSVWINHLLLNHPGGAGLLNASMGVDLNGFVYLAVPYSYINTEVVAGIDIYKLDQNGKLVDTLPYFPWGSPNIGVGGYPTNFFPQGFGVTPEGTAIYGGATDQTFGTGEPAVATAAGGFKQNWISLPGGQFNDPDTTNSSLNLANGVIPTDFSNNAYAGMDRSDINQGTHTTRTNSWIVKFSRSGGYEILQTGALNTLYSVNDCDGYGNMYVMYIENWNIQGVTPTYFLQGVTAGGGVSWSQDLGNQGVGDGVAAKDGFIFQDLTFGATKYNQGGGVKWRNTKICEASDQVFMWARPPWTKANSGPPTF